MFKKFLIGILVAAIVVAGGASAFPTLAAPADETQPVTAAGDLPALPAIAVNVDVTATAETTSQITTTSTLTADETSALLYMFEEEKLARDVYNVLYAQWGQTTFQTIAASEQTHMDSIKILLDRYGIAAPATIAGSFSNSTLQSLYGSLTVTGSLSLADALKVGATIEELDILDLQSRLALTTTADIQLVYNNLMSGSYNHLRNFVSVLSRLSGETYQPQYLSADLYQSILGGTNGNGNGNSNSTNNTTTSSGRVRGAVTGATTTTVSSATGGGHRGGRR